MGRAHGAGTGVPLKLTDPKAIEIIAAIFAGEAAVRPRRRVVAARRSRHTDDMAGKQARRRDKMKRHQQSRQRAVAAKPEPVDELRTINVEIKAIDGAPVDEPHVAVVIEPVTLPSGESLWFQTPFVVPFYLLKAKQLRDLAEPLREAAVTRTTQNKEDGTLRPTDPSRALDALEDMALAVILSVAAIEAHANDMIGRLPEDAMVEITTRIGGQRIPVMRDKAAMEWMRLEDKVARAAPLLHGAPSIKPTVTWRNFKRLLRLRNALVHQRREAVNDPEKPSAFGKLLLGEGSKAPEEAVAVIEAMEPGWIPEKVRPTFGLT